MAAFALPFPSAARHVVLALVLLAMAPAALLARTPGTAEARLVWCAGDPAIVVNGSVVSVTVNIPLENLDDVDYVEVVFRVPANAKVTAVVNDSLLFEARPRYVKDLPAKSGLLGTPITADVIVHHRGSDFPVAVTTVAGGKGTNLWHEGTTAAPLRVTTTGLLNLRLL